MSTQHLGFVVFEPDRLQWSRLRRGLIRLGYLPIAVSDLHELSAVLDRFTVDYLLVGPYGDADEHAPVIERLANRPTTVFVAADVKAPRRIAAYLRLGRGVHVIEPDPERLAEVLAQCAELHTWQATHDVEEARERRRALPRQIPNDLGLNLRVRTV